MSEFVKNKTGRAEAEGHDSTDATNIRANGKPPPGHWRKFEQDSVTTSNPITAIASECSPRFILLLLS